MSYSPNFLFLFWLFRFWIRTTPNFCDPKPRHTHTQRIVQKGTRLKYIVRTPKNRHTPFDYFRLNSNTWFYFGEHPQSNPMQQRPGFGNMFDNCALGATNLSAYTQLSKENRAENGRFQHTEKVEARVFFPSKTFARDVSSSPAKAELLA